MRNPFHSPPMWLATVAVAVLGSVTATSPAFAGPVGKPALALGDGGFTARQLVSPDFGVTQGWRVDQHPRFLADINGDGLADIVGFGLEGTWTALARGDGGFTERRLVSPDFGVTQGWRVDQHPRFLADINGDGLADIVGFGLEGTWTALALGNGGFTERQLVSP